MEGNLASAQRPQAQPGARRLDRVRAGSAPGPPRVHTGSSPGPPRVRPRSPPECLEGVKGLPHQDGFKARGGILRAAKTHVAQSHVSFQPVLAAPAGLEPVSANRFKARLGPKISQETRGCLIPLSVFRLLRRLPLERREFKACRGHPTDNKTQGYLIPLSFVRCLVPRAGLEPSIFKGQAPQKHNKNSRVSDTLEFCWPLGAPGGP